MEYVYATLLLHKAGKKVSEAGLEKVLEAAGVKVDKARAKAVATAVSEVNIDEALKVSAMPVAAPAAAPADAPAKGKKESKKEEKEEETEEEVQGLGALFG